MDPNTCTREEFTEALTSLDPPSDAADAWAVLARNLCDLLEELAYHPAMASNLQQTYMTPATSKNKIYFMWDFVGRTLGYVYKVDPSLKDLSASDQEMWEDAARRTALSRLLITDRAKVSLDQIVESAYGKQAGQTPEFGEEIMEMARWL